MGALEPMNSESLKLSSSKDSIAKHGGVDLPPAHIVFAMLYLGAMMATAIYLWLSAK